MIPLSPSSKGDTTLLIADDHAPLRNMLARALGGMGTQILQAGDGKTALATARNHAPDMIILDINMPQLSGYEVCIALRRASPTRHIPILMLSARLEEKDQRYGLNMGADEYVTKPFDLSILKSRIFALLRRNQESLDRNPLTHLPGNRAICREAERRLYCERTFVFTYVDIRHFKGFNDAYGFHRGDAIILATAKLLCDAVHESGSESFIGHIGGDDFVLMTHAPVDTGDMKNSFKRTTRGFYEDLKKDYLGERSRRYRSMPDPMMTLTIAQVLCEPGLYRNFSQVAQAANRFKELSKHRVFQEGQLT